MTNTTFRLENLNEIGNAEKHFYRYKDLFLYVKRVKNDVSGNPMYHINIKNNRWNVITEKYKGKVGKFYKRGQYISVQSYNIGETLKRILED